MSNFFRRSIAFIMGMVFMLVVLVGGIAGGAYWAYKNLTIGDVVQDVQIGEAASWTVEDCVAFITEVNKDPDGFTLSELEKQGFSFDELFTSIGIDVENADPKDLESLKNIALTSLFSDKALNEVNMGVVFLYIPKDAETNKYPVFSEGARKRLRQYSLGDMFNSDENGQLGLLSVMRPMKIGSILSGSYDEELNQDGTYSYKSEDRGLNLLANLEMSVITDAVESGSIDIGKELTSGDLQSIGDMSIREVVASFGATDQDTFDQNYDKLAFLDGPIINELFVENEETGIYDFDVNKLLSYVNFQNILGYTLCTKDDNCKVHSDVSECDGDIYKKKQVTCSQNEECELHDNISECDGSTKTITVSAGLTGIELDLMRNVLGLGISDFLEGFEFNLLVKDMYLGSAFGYKRVAPPSGSDYCALDCDNTEEGHIHKYYFVDADGNFAGSLMNQLSNISFEGALKGELSLEGILNGLRIGDVMGYIECTGDDSCSVHGTGEHNVGGWYKPVTEGEGDGAVTTYEEVSAIEKTLAGLTFENVLGGTLLDELGDLSIGDIMGFVKCSGNDSCQVHGTGEHNDGAWYSVVIEDDGGVEVKTYKVVSAMEKTLADITISDIIDGKLLDKFDGLYIGELMGYTKCSGDATCTITHLNHDSSWYKLDGENYVEVTGVEKTLADLTINDVLEGKLLDKFSGLAIGELMGYTKCSGDDTCTITHSNHDSAWYKLDGENYVEVTGIEKTLADVTISDILEGKLLDKFDGLYVGELMGYTKCSGDATCTITHLTHDNAWYKLDGEDYVLIDELESAIANLTFDKILSGDISIDGLLQDVTFGSLLGLTYDETQNRWENADGTEADLIFKTLAGLKVGEVLNNPNKITDSLGELYVGEFMGFTQSGEKWLDNENKEVVGINSVLAGIKLSDVLNGSLQIDSELNGVKIGEILGYTYDGVWKDASGQEISCETLTERVFIKLYDKTLADFNGDGLKIEELLEGIKLGEFLGLTYDETQSRWEDKSGNEASLLYKKLADAEISKLLTGETDLTGVLNDVYVGEFMGFVKDGESWLDSDNKQVTGINEIVAGIKLGDVFSGNLNITDKVNEIQIGVILGYTLDGGVWKDASGTPVKTDTMINKVFSKLYGNTLKDFKGDSIKMETLLEGIKLGEFLGLTYDETQSRWEDKSGNEASLLYKKLADAEISKLLTGETDLTGVLNDVYIGEFMGFTKDGTVWKDNGKEVTGVNSIIAEVKLGDVFSGNVDLVDKVNTVKIGVLLGYTYDETKGWLDGSGNAIEKEEIGDKIFYSLYSETISSFKGLEIEKLMQGIYLGEFLGLKKVGGEWKDGENEPSLLYKTLADIEISNLLTSENDLITEAFGGLYVGDFMGFTKNGSVWEDEGVEVTGINKVLAGVSLGSVFDGTISINLDDVQLSDIINPNGNKVLEFLCGGGTTVENIGTRINAMKIGDVVDTSTSQMLKLIEGCTLQELPTAIDGLYVGEIMGFTQSGDAWLSGGVAVSGIKAKIAGLTVSELSNGGFDSIEFVVGDLIENTDSGIFALMDLSVEGGEPYDSASEVPVSEIATRITKGASSASYKQLKNAGIISFDKESDLDTIFSEEKLLYGQDWRDWTVNEILNNLISKIASMGGM